MNYEVSKEATIRQTLEKRSQYVQGVSTVH